MLLAPHEAGVETTSAGDTAASGPTFVNAVHARLLADGTSPTPASAELFFLPESAANDTTRCASLGARIDAYWARRGAVNYFRRRGGADHFTASHFRAALLQCSAWHVEPFLNVFKLVGVLQSPWFVEGVPLPIPARRLHLRPFACQPWMARCPWLPNSTRAATDASKVEP